MLNNQPTTQNEISESEFSVANNLASDVIITGLHNKEYIKKIAPSEVLPTLLCSNNNVSGNTSLGGKIQDEIETKNAKQLSEIIFNLWQKQLKS
jgi:hypothetical protein